MASAENIPFRNETAKILQQQVITLIEQLQFEIQRLNNHPHESNSNGMLYQSLAVKIKTILKDAFHGDIIAALENAIEKLEQAEKLSKEKAVNRDILPSLQAANSALFKAKNIKG